MGDAYTDHARVVKAARKNQEEIDGFFEEIYLFLNPNHKSGTMTSVMNRFMAHDAQRYRNRVGDFSKRKDDRFLKFAETMKAASKNDLQAWAEVLTDAKMRATDKCHQRLHDISPFVGRPVVIIIPHSITQEPTVLGDFIELHTGYSQGRSPMTYLVEMPERAVVGYENHHGELRDERRSRIYFFSC